MRKKRKLIKLLLFLDVGSMDEHIIKVESLFQLQKMFLRILAFIFIIVCMKGVWQNTQGWRRFSIQ